MTARAQHSATQNSWGTRHELTLKMDFDVALSAYFVYSSSDKKCAGRMEVALYRGLLASYKNGGLGGDVNIEVRYNDDGWQSWLLKPLESPPIDAQQAHLDELADAIDNA